MTVAPILKNGERIEPDEDWASERAAAVSVPAPIPNRVTSRQFFVQLAKDGLKPSVDTWIAQQDAVTQAAYEYSNTFVRSDAMLQAGFAALEFTEDEIDAFFTAASKL